MLSAPVFPLSLSFNSTLRCDTLSPESKMHTFSNVLLLSLSQSCTNRLLKRFCIEVHFTSIQTNNTLYFHSISSNYIMSLHVSCFLLPHLMLSAPVFPLSLSFNSPFRYDTLSPESKMHSFSNVSFLSFSIYHKSSVDTY